MAFWPEDEYFLLVEIFECILWGRCNLWVYISYTICMSMSTHTISLSQMSAQTWAFGMALADNWHGLGWGGERQNRVLYWIVSLGALVWVAVGESREHGDLALLEHLAEEKGLK